MSQKRWNVSHPDPQKQVALSNSLGIHPIVAQLLINRQIDSLSEARMFLSGDLKSLHDPFLFKDMDKAVERIRRAQKKNETVLIFGDYDVDGVTSSVILKNLFKSLGIKTLNYIPHRMTEGYGLNHNIVQIAKDSEVSAVFAVDCGINAFSVAEALSKEGIDLIILDHHEPTPGQLPLAHAIINPKREDCSYPFKSLASVGLAFKLSQAVLGRIDEEILDLVSIGTIADVAELRGENRIFVKEGLPKITQTKNFGLQALLDVAKIKDKKFRPYYVGFILGPRLNATGRMGSATESLQLLLSENKDEAYVLAKSLEEHNQIRQKTQNDIIQEAMSLVEREVNFKEHKVIVLNKPGWHRGVLGIVASRIVEKYYRPAIVISTENGVGTGSARSIDGFHLFEALQACSTLLENFGGHKRAAGLTVRSEKIEEFKIVINEFAKTNLTIEQLTPSLEIDAEIPIGSLDEGLVQTIDALEPFGEGNPSPVLCSRRLKTKSPPVVMGKDTLKFWVTDGKATFAAVGFGMSRYKDVVEFNEPLDLAYSPAVDEWNNQTSVTLKIKDIKNST